MSSHRQSRLSTATRVVLVEPPASAPPVDLDEAADLLLDLLNKYGRRRQTTVLTAAPTDNRTP